MCTQRDEGRRQRSTSAGNDSQSNEKEEAKKSEEKVNGINWVCSKMSFDSFARNGRNVDKFRWIFNVDATAEFYIENKCYFLLSFICELNIFRLQLAFHWLETRLTRMTREICKRKNEVEGEREKTARKWNSKKNKNNPTETSNLEWCDARSQMFFRYFGNEKA